MLEQTQPPAPSWALGPAVSELVTLRDSSSPTATTPTFWGLWAWAGSPVQAEVSGHFKDSKHLRTPRPRAGLWVT